MNNWKKYKLGEIAEVQTGPFGSQLHMKDYKDIGTPIITVEHLGDNNIIHSNLPLVGDADKERLKKYILQKGDIVFSRVGSVDRRAYVTDKENGWMFSGRCLRVRTNKSYVNSRFLSFYFGQEKFKDNIRKIAVGATMPSINTTILSEIEIFIPDLPTQTQIAQILSSFDDKIECLMQMNQTLETMAQAIFKEWFVNFNFPGFDGELVDGLPKGWRMGKLGEMLTIKRGGSPRPIQNYIAEKGLRWLKISDVTGLNTPFILETKEFIIEEGLSKTTFLKAGSLVLSNSATPGIPKILNVDSCIHDGWLHFPTSKFSNEFLYLQFLKLREELIQLSNGSIFTNLKTDIVREFEIPIAPNEILNKFDNIIKPIFQKLLNNTIEINTLTQLRDSLLPKLMSGTVEV